MMLCNLDFLHNGRHVNGRFYIDRTLCRLEFSERTFCNGRFVKGRSVNGSLVGVP
jgi:hypothetical protein